MVRLVLATCRRHVICLTRNLNSVALNVNSFRLLLKVVGLNSLVGRLGLKVVIGLLRWVLCFWWMGWVTLRARRIRVTKVRTLYLLGVGRRFVGRVLVIIVNSFLCCLMIVFLGRNFLSIRRLKLKLNNLNHSRTDLPHFRPFRWFVRFFVCCLNCRLITLTFALEWFTCVGLLLCLWWRCLVR